MKALFRIFTAILFLAFAGNNMAQTDDFRPDNPPEPNTLYKITVSAQPSDAAYASGTGSYKSGTYVWISTSSYTQGFTFLYWTKNGEKYTEDQYFDYLVTTENADFVAVYEYAPYNPEEPNTPNNFRLHLKQTPEGCCSFNRTSGEKHEADTWVDLSAYPNQGFVFMGWYKNGQKVSNAQYFNFLMPYEETTLTARFVFNPTNPGDPTTGAGQPSIDNGNSFDINGDGMINVADVVTLVNIILGTDQGGKNGDVNGDGTVNVADVVTLVNKCLGNI